jgi:ketosteroid isomerase-like protein
MSQENVEIVRRAFEAFNGADAQGLDDWAVEFLDPEIEWQTSREDPDATTHRGREAVRRYVDQWLDSFVGMHADVEECIEAGEDRVVTWVRWTGKGRGSGIDAEWWLATFHTLRGDKVVRVEEYFDRTEALEAAGISE